jgi:hypothetical protein
MNPLNIATLDKPLIKEEQEIHNAIYFGMRKYLKEYCSIKEKINYFHLTTTSSVLCLGRISTLPNSFGR